MNDTPLAQEDNLAYEWSLSSRPLRSANVEPRTTNHQLIMQHIVEMQPPRLLRFPVASPIWATFVTSRPVPY